MIRYNVVKLFGMLALLLNYTDAWSFGSGTCDATSTAISSMPSTTVQLQFTTNTGNSNIWSIQTQQVLNTTTTTNTTTATTTTASSSSSSSSSSSNMNSLLGAFEGIVGALPAGVSQLVNDSTTGLAVDLTNTSDNTTVVSINSTSVALYTPNVNNTLNIVNTDSTQSFTGFLVYGTDDNGNRIGVFTPSSTDNIMSTCTPSGSTLTHSTADAKPSGYVLTYAPPTNYTQPITMNVALMSADRTSTIFTTRMYAVGTVQLTSNNVSTSTTSSSGTAGTTISTSVQSNSGTTSPPATTLLPATTTTPSSKHSAATTLYTDIQAIDILTYSLALSIPAVIYYVV